MRSLKFGNALFCEYVARGAGNKHTLVNVFSGDILVKELPGTLILSLYIEMLPQLRQQSEITIDLLVGRKPYVQFEASFESMRRDKTAVLVISPLHVEVQKDTFLRVVASSKGFQRTEVIRKRISEGEPITPSASAPLSEQCPSDDPKTSFPRVPSRRGGPQKPRPS
jgi:hypothetical protein